jgi:hypothetical protein
MQDRSVVTRRMKVRRAVVPVMTLAVALTAAWPLIGLAGTARVLLVVAASIAAGIELKSILDEDRLRAAGLDADLIRSPLRQRIRRALGRS